VTALSSPVLTVQSGTRQRIYAALLSEPRGDWTRRMAELMPEVSVDGVRAMLHLLFGERLVDMVKRQRSLTLRLTGDGEQILAKIHVERRALVRLLSAQVLAVRSPARVHVYAALVSDGENRWWTVRQMAEVMPDDISASTVWAVLYLLLGDAVLELVPRQRNLTLRLSGNGLTVLSELLAQWKAADVESRLPRAAGIGGTR